MTSETDVDKRETADLGKYFAEQGLPPDDILDPAVQDEAMERMRLGKNIAPEAGLASALTPQRTHAEVVVTRASEVWDKWADEARLGASILQERAMALATRATGFQDELSLVSIGDDAPPGLAPRTVTLVKWEGASSMGREGRLDQQWRVKWATPSMFPLRDFRACKIVHPAIGVKMEKLRAHRNPIPDKIKRLRQMWSVAEHCARAPLDVCVMCGMDDTKDGADPSPGQELTHCALCLLPWHAECCEVALRHLRARISTTPLTGLPRDALPTEFTTSSAAHEAPMCVMCRAWLRV